MLLSFLATVIAYTAPIVAARGRGGGGSVDVNLTLDLSSINTATFSFFIIFAIFTAFQAWVALGLTRNHNEHCTAAPFVILLFATLLLVAYYAMGAVYVSLGLSRSKFTDLGGGFYAMLSFTDRVVDVLVAGAIAMLLDNRMTYMVQHHGWIPANRMLKRIIEMSLLSVMMLVIVIGVIIRGVALTTSDPRSALKASANLYHAYIAFYIFITAHISVTSIALSSRMSLANVTDPVSSSQELESYVPISSVAFPDHQDHRILGFAIADYTGARQIVHRYRHFNAKHQLGLRNLVIGRVAYYWDHLLCCDRCYFELGRSSTGHRIL